MDIAENYKCPIMTRFFMRLLGMWPSESAKEKLFADFILTWSINMMVLSSLAMTFDFWFQRKNFVEICYVIPCVSVTYAELTKLLVFFSHRKEVLDFIKFTQTYYWRKCFPPEYQQILKKVDEISYPACATFILLVQGVTWHYIFIPIFESWGKQASERKLVFRWYFDLVPYTESPYYEWVMSIQVVSTFYVGVIFAASAIFLFTINVYCASYFYILRKRFEMLCDNIEHSNNDNCKNAYSEVLYYEMLKDCIKEHKLLIEYVKRIDYLYKNIMLVQVMSSVMQICFSGFQILLGASSSIQRTILSGEYVVGSFVELYFFAVSSDQIRINSSEIHEAVYKSKWYLLSYNKEGRKFREAVKFVIARAAYPSVVHVGDFAVMSYDIFTWVSKTSMSYFTVLRQFMENNENLG